ncbi:MAG: MarR family transcriptional regulator [Thermoanaerobaculia bacterium]|nr:MarR family transcriptional regulator [Thermoanaerobaculia bacterium]
MPPSRDLVAGIVQLANLLNRRLAPVFEKVNVTPQQWAVLVVIAADEPMTLAGVARSLAVSKQNMTGMMTRLEQLGLVERAEDPQDLRSARVRLSRRGRSVIERLMPAYEKWRDALGGEIGTRDVQTLERAVNRLIEHLEQQP